MPEAVMLIGVGELGGVFARGLLKLGRPVVPVLRGQSISERLAVCSDPELVMVTVGEADLPAVLAALPAAVRDRVVLVQNELLPRSWLAHGIEDPTVVVVWFEKKMGRPAHSVLPSVVCGRAASTLTSTLRALGLPCREVPRSELEFELVSKNLYILVHNTCGLVENTTVRQLWAQNPGLAEAVARETLAIQEALCGHALDRERLMVELKNAVQADPDHLCAGRTARQRLHRALAHAVDLGISAPTMASVQTGAGS